MHTKGVLLGHNDRKTWHIRLDNGKNENINTHKETFIFYLYYYV